MTDDAGPGRDVDVEPVPEREVDVDDVYDVLEDRGRPVVTASEVARALECTPAAAEDALDALAETGRLERFDASTDPVVWYPTDWKETVDRERAVLFPNRREVVVDRPSQFTRARLSGFAHLVETNRSGGYVYEIRPEDVWQAPHDDLDSLLDSVRAVVGERSRKLEEWIESQWGRAHAFRLYTHEDGYVVLEARSADLLGNVAEQHLEAGHVRARIGDTEAWVAESATADVKRALYEAGYPVQDERTLDAGDDLPIDLHVDLRDYQRTWVDRFVETGSGVLVGPPGSGKTIAALGAMAAVGGETLVLVPSRGLVDQWREALLAHTTLSGEQVGEYHGGRKEIRPVTVATYHTAGMDRHRALFEERAWGLVVYDEVHHVPAPVHRRTADLQTKHRLGLSVDGDTVLPIRRDGEVDLVRIETLASEFLAEETGIEPVKGIETLAVDQRGRVKWSSVRSVMRHHHGENMYRVRSRNGREVDVTGDHSLMVYDANHLEITDKTPDELGDDDFLLQPAALPGGLQVETEIDVIPFLEEGFVLIEDDAPDTVFEPLYEQSIGSNKDRYNWKTRRSLPLTVASEIGLDAAFIKGVYVYGRDHYIPPTVDTEDLARLLGLFAADGALDQNRVEFYAADSEEHSEIEEFERIIHAVCPEADLSHVANGENCTTIRVSGPLVSLLESFGLSNGARNKRVPPLVLSNPAAYQPFIDGVVLGDGHRQDRTRDRSIVTISTSSDLLAHGLSFLLSSLGYPGGNYRRKSGVGVRPGEHDTTTNNLIRFNPRNDGKTSRLEMTPFSEPLRAAYDALERYSTDGGPPIESGLSGRERLNAHELGLLTDRTDDLDCDWLRTAEVALMEVSSVEKVESQEFVYDISTDEENFLGNHLFCHNSATPLREDDAEVEIFTLVGPPIGTDWGALFDAGYVAEPEVEIRYVPWGSDDARNAYASAEGHERRQLAASNPAKVDEIRHVLRAHPGQKALVFVEYLDQGEEIADALGVPFVSGKTPHARRRRLFGQFRSGPRDVLVVSRIGDEGLDLPEAEVAIAASGLGGSRRQGAQRAGRTMRPVGRARMYVLATRGTEEEDFARRRMRHLAGKGVRVRERGAAADE